MWNDSWSKIGLTTAIRIQIKNGKKCRSIYNGKYIKFIQNNKLKTPAAAYNEEFELSEGSYTVSDIQDYFDYLKKTWRKDW